MEKQSHTFQTILENNKGIIYKVANSYCKEEVDREDLIQEIIIQLWKSFPQYDSQYKLSTWIYRISLNVSISYYRKNKVRNEKTERISPFILHSVPEEEEEDQKGEELLLLEKFIKELKEIDKALMLLYLEGKNHVEISEILGISKTNIATKVGRIKKVLKQKFETLKQ